MVIMTNSPASALSIPDILGAFAACIGANHVLTGDDATPYFHDYSGRYQGNGLAVLLPADTQQVSELVKICAAHKIAIVPQGGNTGLVGGSIPYQDNAVVISLKRMNTIRMLDAEGETITVDAGCILQTIQNAAADQNMYFPLALGAQGSCSIGGNIATNAGGILTMRYGNMRDLVLGLEVVLPNGDIWNGLRGLRKDNSGYALKHVFIGSEGTLGIITGAVLKLYPDPGKRVTFFAAINELSQGVAFLDILRRHFGGNIQAYELLSQPAMNAIMRYMPTARQPFAEASPWSLLVEITDPHHDSDLMQHVEDCLAHAFEQHIIHDAVIAQNDTQRRQFWEMRECVSDAIQSSTGGSIKHDIAIAIADIPAFVRDANARVTAALSHIVPAPFGHMGDGNLHYDLIMDESGDTVSFLSHWSEMNAHIHDVTAHYHGSFAAEHGVGHFKTHEYAHRKSPVDQALMRKVKHAIDPDNIMNPNTIWNTETHE